VLYVLEMQRGTHSGGAEAHTDQPMPEDAPIVDLKTIVAPQMKIAGPKPKETAKPAAKADKAPPAPKTKRTKAPKPHRPIVHSNPARQRARI
jgi:hypothetical protein